MNTGGGAAAAALNSPGAGAGPSLAAAPGTQEQQRLNNAAGVRLSFKCGQWPSKYPKPVSSYKGRQVPWKEGEDMLQGPSRWKSYEDINTKHMTIPVKWRLVKHVGPGDGQVQVVEPDEADGPTFLKLTPASTGFSSHKFQWHKAGMRDWRISMWEVADGGSYPPDGPAGVPAPRPAQITVHLLPPVPEPGGGGEGEVLG
eukprot:CAMPEP_0202857928 /NCGR_PEP_ID=MMETSP1391-20130828/678_1 /ASSEMBLY_ACC=CAM_ASM_000867 /TAXON_ID=1034604 /ORGANISM="Chlamydomonas leiostraca, Strain SAG 11-49" /LENGTH=199 /DNA_ID=CAMNT_0049536793 /DNA_START=151 /DNA_END=747 /DNA_ORIENTATION=+